MSVRLRWKIPMFLRKRSDLNEWKNKIRIPTFIRIRPKFQGLKANNKMRTPIFRRIRSESQCL